MFFCTVVGERTYLRFVPANDDWTVSTDDGAIVDELGTCLRLIACEVDQETWYPEWLQDRVYDLWEAAQENIWTEWMHETNPANLQPKVRPLTGSGPGATEAAKHTRWTHGHRSARPPQPGNTPKHARATSAGRPLRRGWNRRARRCRDGHERLGNARSIRARRRATSSWTTSPEATSSSTSWSGGPAEGLIDEGRTDHRCE